jgi:hypothetical protein
VRLRLTFLYRFQVDPRRLKKGLAAKRKLIGQGGHVDDELDQLERAVRALPDLQRFVVAIVMGRFFAPQRPHRIGPNKFEKLWNQDPIKLAAKMLCKSRSAIESSLTLALQQLTGLPNPRRVLGDLRSNEAMHTLLSLTARRMLSNPPRSDSLSKTSKNSPCPDPSDALPDGHDVGTSETSKNSPCPDPPTDVTR